MATISGLIILGCWIIFIAYWIASAMRVKATAERQSLWSALAHRIPLGFSYLLMANWHLPPPLNLSPATSMIGPSGMCSPGIHSG